MFLIRFSSFNIDNPTYCDIKVYVIIINYGDNSDRYNNNIYLIGEIVLLLKLILDIKKQSHEFGMHSVLKKKNLFNRTVGAINSSGTVKDQFWTSIRNGW